LSFIKLLDLLELDLEVVVWSNFVIFLGFFGFIIFILNYILISLMFLEFRLFPNRGRFSWLIKVL
jgi:hypothetical protein